MIYGINRKNEEEFLHWAPTWAPEHSSEGSWVLFFTWAIWRNFFNPKNAVFRYFWAKTVVYEVQMISKDASSVQITFEVMCLNLVWKFFQNFAKRGEK